MASVIDEIDKPNKTLQELWEILYYDEEIPVTIWELQKAVKSGELEKTQYGNRNYFSIRDGLNWLEGRRGKKRAAPKAAAH